MTLNPAEHARALGLGLLGELRQPADLLARPEQFPGLIVAIEPGTTRDLGGADQPTARPPTIFSSTGSGPRPARSHSAAQAWTSARRSPISAGPGPRSGTGNGSQLRPVRKFASRTGHFLRTPSRTSAGPVHAPPAARRATSGHR